MKSLTETVTKTLTKIEARKCNQNRYPDFEAVLGTLKLHNCHLSKLKPPDQTSCNLLLLRDLLGAQFSHCATFFPGIPDTMGLKTI